MVEVDAGDDDAVGIKGIHRIEAPAQADFHDHQVELFMRQKPRDGQRGELEFAQRDVAARLLHRFEMWQQRGRRHRGAVHTAALLKMHQLRFLVQADTVAGVARHRFDHGAGGAFAIGAGHDDQRHLEVQIQATAQLGRALKRRVHGLGWRALKVAQPVGKIRGQAHKTNTGRVRPGARRFEVSQATASAFCRCNSATMRAIVGRSWRLSMIMSSAPFPSRNSAR